jgi:hypothetical protein
MNGAHLRRAPYRPRLEFTIGLLGLAICALGIGLVTADVLDKTPAELRLQEPTTTTTMINSSVIEPETTTTVEPTTTTPAKNPPLSRVYLQKARVFVPTTVASQQATITTTTEAPKTPLEIAHAELGKTGPYAEGGFWCAKFVSWVAEQAKVEGWQSNDSPARLHTIAKEQGRLTDTPLPGYLVFIDLTGQNNANEYISHVGIVESVEGTTIHSIEGNADNSGLVTRQTREVGDGFVVDFARFEQ